MTTSAARRKQTVGHRPIAFLATLSLALGGCGFFSDADQKFYFHPTETGNELEPQYISLAQHLHSIKPCFLISPNSLSLGSFNPVGSQVSLVRSRCFSQVARLTHDARICDRVRSASTLLYSGADENAQSCRIASQYNGMIAYRMEVKEIVQLAGYGEDEVDTYLTAAARFSSVAAAERFRREQPVVYWAEARAYLLPSREFFSRIDRLPAFGTAADREEMAAVAWRPLQQRHQPPPEQRTQRRPYSRMPASADKGAAPGSDGAAASEVRQ